MNKVDLKELKGQLQSDLDKSVMGSTVLLDRFVLQDDKSKAAGAYTDPRYIPFYYYLGKRVSPTTLLHAGLGLGLASGVFLMGCPSVEHFLGFQDPAGEFYSPRFAIKNIKSKYKKLFEYYVGNFKEEELGNKLKQKEWDLVLVTDMMSYDQHRECLDILWEHTAYDGLFVVDHISHEPNSKAFVDFCKIINQEPISLKTRYGVSILKK